MERVEAKIIEVKKRSKAEETARMEVERQANAEAVCVRAKRRAATDEDIITADAAQLNQRGKPPRTIYHGLNRRGGRQQ